MAYVFFLVAVFRHTDGSVRSETPASRFLFVVTRIGLVVAALAAVFQLIRVGMAPHYYFLYRDMAAQVGKSAPTLTYLLGDSLRSFLVVLCYFTAPFLVHMGIRHAPRTEPMTKSLSM